jgi:hypothetical protein
MTPSWPGVNESPSRREVRNRPPDGGDFDHNHPTFELAAIQFTQRPEYFYVEQLGAGVY